MDEKQKEFAKDEADDGFCISVELRIRKMNDAELNEPERRIRSYYCPTDQIVTIGDGDAAQNFKFKRIHDEETTQTEMFASAQKIVRTALDGVNCTVFAYGQTGSGKTYTISGGAWKKNGIVQ
jgi:DNA replication protein DnaC